MKSVPFQSLEVVLAAKAVCEKHTTFNMKAKQRRLIVLSLFKMGESVLKVIEEGLFYYGVFYLGDVSYISKVISFILMK